MTESQMLALTAAALAMLAFFAWFTQRATGEAAFEIPDDMPDQEAGIVESAIGNVQSMVGDAVSTVTVDDAEINTRAFLDMLAYAEGTTKNGYNTLFGGGTFDNLADHPRRLFPFTNGAGKTLKTTAAGRYQFLSRTWDSLRDKLNLPDFGPESQDAAALELVRQRGALADVRAGRVAAAIAKCAPIWASLPGAGYDQPERKIGQLLTAYNNAGGTNTA